MKKRCVHTAVQDIQPLLEYGRRLCALLGKLGSRDAWQASTFENLAWLPATFQVAVLRWCPPGAR